MPLAQLRKGTGLSHARGGNGEQDIAPASDEDRPLGLRQGASEAVAAALSKLQSRQTAPADPSDEDDLPLGSTHPQAAIIARQAAQIRRLQQAQQMAAMSPAMSMMPWSQSMGSPSMMSCSLPMQMPAATSSMMFPSQAMLQQYYEQGPSGAVTGMMSPHLGGPTPAEAVKASSIERWRDDVR